MAEAQTNSDLLGRSLRDYVRVARHRVVVILAVTAAVLIVAMGLTFSQPKKYTAVTRFTIEAPRIVAVGDSPNKSPLDNHIALLRGEPMRNAARAQLGYVAEVSVSAEGNSSIVRLEATSTDPARAAAVANAYVQLYPSVRSQAAADAYASAAPLLQEQLKQLDAGLADVEAQRQAAHDQVRARQDQLLTRQREVELLQDRFFKNQGDPASQTNIDFESELTSIRQQLANLNTDLVATDARLDNIVRPKRALRDQVAQQLDAASLESGLAQNTALQVLTSANPPTSPSSPKPVQNALLGLIGGLLLGMVVALLVDYFRDTIDSVDDLEESAKPLATLAVVPKYKGAETEIITAAEIFAPASAAYHLLRTSIGIEPSDGRGIVIQVTSPDPQAGKTTTAVNLAVAYSMAGKRVVIVDADLRRPRVHELLNVSNDVGFSSVLLQDGESLGPVAIPVKGFESLCVFPAGQVASDPTTILSGTRVGPFFDLLRDVADVIVVDCPPVIVAPDAAILAVHSDAVVFLARTGHTMQRQVRRSLEQLRRANAPLVGTVLNEAPSDDLLYRGNYAGYYSSSTSYGSPNGDTRQRRRTTIFRRRKAAHAKTSGQNGTGVDSSQADRAASNGQADADEPQPTPTIDA